MTLWGKTGVDNCYLKENTYTRLSSLFQALEVKEQEKNKMVERVNSFLKQPFCRLNFNLVLNCFTNMTLIKM